MHGGRLEPWLVPLAEVIVIAMLSVPTLSLEGAVIAASIAIGYTGFLSNSPSKPNGSTESTVS